MELRSKRRLSDATLGNRHTSTGATHADTAAFSPSECLWDLVGALRALDYYEDGPYKDLPTREAILNDPLLHDHFTSNGKIRSTSALMGAMDLLSARWWGYLTSNSLHSTLYAGNPLDLSGLSERDQALSLISAIRTVKRFANGDNSGFPVRSQLRRDPRLASHFVHPGILKADSVLSAFISDESMLEQSWWHYLTVNGKYSTAQASKDQAGKARAAKARTAEAPAQPESSTIPSPGENATDGLTISSTVPDPTTAINESDPRSQPEQDWQHYESVVHKLSQEGKDEYGICHQLLLRAVEAFGSIAQQDSTSQLTWMCEVSGSYLRICLQDILSLAPGKAVSENAMHLLVSFPQEKEDKKKYETMIVDVTYIRAGPNGQRGVLKPEDRARVLEIVIKATREGHINPSQLPGSTMLDTVKRISVLYHVQDDTWVYVRLKIDHQNKIGQIELHNTSHDEVGPSCRTQLPLVAEYISSRPDLHWDIRWQPVEEKSCVKAPSPCDSFIMAWFCAQNAIGLYRSKEEKDRLFSQNVTEFAQKMRCECLSYLLGRMQNEAKQAEGGNSRVWSMTEDEKAEQEVKDGARKIKDLVERASEGRMSA
ncbi:hypothetical protein KC333_g5549 [Hortaea werneckii]|nr:hypothetical protein KC333_g5549 [Hortaea werneckii]KAI7308717.1 hypothetical protein KC326_g7312 [Hortaea werneckii]